MENKHKHFKPFQKVIVKSKIDNKWHCEFYSHYNAEKNWHTVTIGTGIDDNEILPYEGNEALVGTNDESEEEIKLEKGEKIICSDHIDRLEKGYGVLEDFYKIEGYSFMTDEGNWTYKYAIRFKDFNPNDMEETKKHILCVKNSKIIKYKE